MHSHVKSQPKVHAKLYQTNYILYKVLEGKLLCYFREEPVAQRVSVCRQHKLGLPAEI